MSGDTADLALSGSTSGTPGGSSDTSTSSGVVGTETDNTDTAVLSVVAGETVNLTEVLSGNTGVYSTVFACLGNTNGTGGGGLSRTLVIHADDTDITCTYTNTVLTADLTLVKEWVNGVSGDTADLTLSGPTSGSDIDTSVASGGNQTDNAN